jgi:hypothetical protein
MMMVIHTQRKHPWTIFLAAAPNLSAVAGHHAGCCGSSDPQGDTRTPGVRYFCKTSGVYQQRTRPTLYIPNLGLCRLSMQDSPHSKRL